MDEDPLSFLQYGTKEDIMTFLKWILDEYRVRKRSTLHKYWRVRQMLYRRCVGHSLHAKITGDINDVGTPSRSLQIKEDSADMRQYIDVDLIRLYNLDLSTKEKPAMNVDDVLLVLYHYWAMDTATFPTGDNGYRLLSWY
jgi:hypothetical protein